MSVFEEDLYCCVFCGIACFDSGTEIIRNKEYLVFSSKDQHNCRVDSEENVFCKNNHWLGKKFATTLDFFSKYNSDLPLDEFINFMKHHLFLDSERLFEKINCNAIKKYSRKVLVRTLSRTEDQKISTLQCNSTENAVEVSTKHQNHLYCPEDEQNIPDSKRKILDAFERICVF